MTPDTTIYRDSTTGCMSQFKIYYQNNGFKFDYSQAKFNVELTTNFNIRVRSVTRCSSTIEGHTEAVISVAFSPDGK